MKEAEQQTKPRRFVVLSFNKGWIVWDNVKHRISDGIYSGEFGVDYAVQSARVGNEDPELLDRDWMADCGDLPDEVEI